jgi:hypothetical protein
VPFGDGAGALTEDPSTFVYDTTNNVLRVPTVVGGTGTGDDLRLRATTGVGGTGARVFIEGGNNGAVPLVEFRLDDALSNGRVGIGTAAVGRAVLAPLTIFGVGADIGYLISATAHASVESAFCQMISAGGNANAQAGFSFYQQSNLIEWRASVVGNGGNAFRWQAINSGGGAYTNTVAQFMPASMNLLLASAHTKDVTTGTRALVVEKGTAPTACASDTSALFTRDDAAGIAQLCAINEGGTITQLTGVRPVVLVKKSTTQSLTSGVRTAITFDVEAFDVGGCHDNATNNTRLTVPTGADGTYFITANAEYASNTAGIRAAELKQNGTTTLAQVITAAVVGDITVVQVIAVAPLVAGDYVELNGLQTSGGALNVGDDSSSLSWTRL